MTHYTPPSRWCHYYIFRLCHHFYDVIPWGILTSLCPCVPSAVLPVLYYCSWTKIRGNSANLATKGPQKSGRKNEVVVSNCLKKENQWVFDQAEWSGRDNDVAVLTGWLPGGDTPYNGLYSTPRYRQHIISLQNGTSRYWQKQGRKGDPIQKPVVWSPRRREERK